MKIVQLAALLLLLTTSCTKIIDIDLNTTDPRLVIEGEITDQMNGCIVKLSQTTNFSSPNVYAPVRGAVITIDVGLKTVLLKEIEAGLYVTQEINGQSGKTYTLTVNQAGKTYLATSTMPNAVDLYGAEISESPFGNRPGADEKNYEFLPLFDDPAHEKNYYRFIFESKGMVDNNFLYAFSDNLTNGITNPIPLPQSEDFDLAPGDTVTMEMRCLDKKVYEYFYSLGQLSGDGNGAATPANPLSNFNSNALGYFGAFTIRKIKAVVP